MLHVEFRDLESFIEWLKEESPSGERYYCFDGKTLIAVVQSSRRRAVLRCEPEDFDKVSDVLEELGFRIVAEIRFPH